MKEATVITDLDALIDEAARVIRRGGVCVIPTETAYGLAASPRFQKALERIYEIKKRPRNKPLLLLVNSIDQAPVELEGVHAYVFELMKRFWPGPLTLLLPASSKASPFLTAGTKKVGVRISSHPVAQKVIERVGGAVTGTSANISGKGLTKTISQVKAQLVDPMPDFFLDAGAIPEGPSSTIVDCCGDVPVIIRQGAIVKEDILSVC